MPLFSKKTTIAIGNLAPELAKNLQWINSGPLSSADLKNKIVLLGFFSYTDLNSLRSVPYLEYWHQKYKDLAVQVVGVHSPQFSFERDIKNVSAAIGRLGLTFPVIHDPDHKIWDLWQNDGWTKKFLVTSRGAIFFEALGEEKYPEFEKKIQELLKTDLFWSPEKIPVMGLIDLIAKGILPSGVRYPSTPPTFLGFGRAGSNSEKVVKNKIAQYKANEELARHSWNLEGTWLAKEEFLEHPALVPSYSDFLAISFSGTTVNCVLESESGAAIECVIRLDDRFLQSDIQGDDVVLVAGRSTFTVKEPRVYNLIRSDSMLEGLLKIYVREKGLRLFLFTFGNGPEGKLKK